MIVEGDPETVLLPEAVRALLLREHEAHEIAGLHAAVMGKIDAVSSDALDPRIAGVLASESSFDVDAFHARLMEQISAIEEAPIHADVARALAAEAAPGADPMLAMQIMTRIEIEVALELEGDTSPALGEVRAELARESERMQAERVVSEVSAEIRSIGPRIEREMPRAVAARIAPATVIPMRRHWVARAAAGAMAAAAAMMLYLRAPDPSSVPPVGLPPLDPGGEVVVDAVRFDGTVTVTENEGVAVIWLSDAPVT